VGDKSSQIHNKAENNIVCTVTAN